MKKIRNLCVLILVFALMLTLTLTNSKHKNILQSVSSDHQYHDNVNILTYSTLSYPVFGSDYQSKDIKSITFLDSLKDIPRDAWDVSEAQDGSVMAWVIDGALYIAGNGGVYGNEDSSFLFASYRNVESINFNDCFYTEDITDMSRMFLNCQSLTSLDLSSFQTSNVTNMYSMFSECVSLTDLDISSFDTSNVTSMVLMFSSCSALKNLDISHFDMTNADTSYMFLDTIYED